MGTLTDGADTWIVVDFNGQGLQHRATQHLRSVDRYQWGCPPAVNGTGALPTSATELRVTGTPGAPGETHTITFQVRGVKAGTWTNYAFMTSNLFQGTAAAFFGGQVTK